MRAQGHAPSDTKPCSIGASDFDVTNTVQVSSTRVQLFRQNWPHYPFDRVESAFQDFERLFNGQFPGYYGCDTVVMIYSTRLDGRSPSHA